jgi:hypothetical protein
MAVRLQMILTLIKVVMFQLAFVESSSNLSQAACSQVVGGLMLVVARDVNILTTISMIPGYTVNLEVIMNISPEEGKM